MVPVMEKKNDSMVWWPFCLLALSAESVRPPAYEVVVTVEARDAVRFCCGRARTQPPCRPTLCRCSATDASPPARASRPRTACILGTRNVADHSDSALRCGRCDGSAGKDQIDAREPTERPRPRAALRIRRRARCACTRAHRAVRKWIALLG